MASSIGIFINANIIYTMKEIYPINFFYHFNILYIQYNIPIDLNYIKQAVQYLKTEQDNHHSEKIMKIVHNAHMVTGIDGRMIKYNVYLNVIKRLI